MIAAAAVHAGPALCAHAAGLCEALAITRRLPDPGTVALTFDDGPHPQATPLVLSLLADHHATATFFLVGEQVRRHPSVAREIAAAGHAIALHGDTHRCELRLTAGAVADDRARGCDTIASVTGITPALHRPPYGAASAAGLALARRAGLATVLWSRWAQDWRARATPQTVADKVLASSIPAGDIVLLHDADHYSAAGCWRSTVGALPRILSSCADANLRTVGLARDLQDHRRVIVTTGDEYSMRATGAQ